jgi:hypothetical protein
MRHTHPLRRGENSPVNGCAPENRSDLAKGRIL